MSQVQGRADLSNIINQDEEFDRHASIIISSLVDVVNGQLEFGSNIKSQLLSVVFPATNTDATFNHTLGYAPTGIIPVLKNVAGDIYSGSVAWTNSTICLRCTGLVTGKVLVF